MEKTRARGGHGAQSVGRELARDGSFKPINGRHATVQTLACRRWPSFHSERRKLTSRTPFSLPNTPKCGVIYDPPAWQLSLPGLERAKEHDQVRLVRER
jgi:hypothetical protein